MFTEFKWSLFQVLSLFFVIIYLFGALNIYFSDRNQYCAMTYMFEYPQFVRITVPENKIYPQYGLYAYSEGRLTEKARKMWFDGIPVLFLPGNSGSHMQGRSLASVALRKALSYEYNYHFDFFMISYNEELSAFYGGVLDQQTEFAAHCISRILSLYKHNKYTKSVPSSVILIGHSMGGIVAKRLLMYSDTINATNIAITLAAPLEAPVVNFDLKFNEYYKKIEYEWELNHDVRNTKLLLSFGNGARDILVPSGIIASKDDDLSTLATSVPGVWVSPDHVSIVWCKQLVKAINKFLFSIVDMKTEQIITNKQILLSNAKQYFQANRSIVLDSNKSRANVTMLQDGFWYEDNRRVYQISRPEIDKTTYLMIRLVSFYPNRFVAVETVNVHDTEWLFGCNAKFTHGTHRYCKSATSLSELTRWSASVPEFGKRKLATVHLHDIMDKYPEWTHVIVKVSPTRKPIILNVDINDYASREITVDLPYSFSFAKTTVVTETEKNALYYELKFPGINLLYNMYFLNVEPTPNCKASQYHVTAEMHVPWASGHEYHHYFTHLKHSPMKLRLFKTNSNVTHNLELAEHVKVTLLLDPQCTFSISISPSPYYQIGQMVRHYTPLLLPYVAAIIVLITRSNIINLNKNGKCISVHGCLTGEEVKPYYILVFTRMGSLVIKTVPVLAFLFETASSKNSELQYFSRSLLTIPVYMTALGIVNVVALVLLAVMVFSSQLAHRLLFRILWRRSTGIAEKVASGLQKVPTVVSAALVCAVPVSCGAASLVAGAAYYAFVLSKMYEEYLEDYIYKLMAKLGSKFCFFFKSKKKSNVNDQEEKLALTHSDNNEVGTNDIAEQNNELTIQPQSEKVLDTKVEKPDDKKESDNLLSNDKQVAECDHPSKKADTNKNKDDDKQRKPSNVISGDDVLSGINFHMMLFFLWMVVTIVNVPALLTWAKNFKYSMLLQPDTSYYPGFIMSICAGFVWQMDGPRKNLKHYNVLSQLLLISAVLILVLGPLGLYYINYIISIIFALITFQQLFDKEVSAEQMSEMYSPNQDDGFKSGTQENNKHNEEKENKQNEDEDKPSSSHEHSHEETSECDCNESRIYNLIRNVREKFNVAQEQS